MKVKDTLSAIGCCVKNEQEQTTDHCKHCPYNIYADECFIHKDKDALEMYSQIVIDLRDATADLKATSIVLDRYIAGYKALTQLLRAIIEDNEPQEGQKRERLSQREILALADYVEKIAEGKIVCEG